MKENAVVERVQPPAKWGERSSIYTCEKECIDLINSPGRLLGNKCILQIAGHKLNKETVIGC